MEFLQKLMIAILTVSMLANVSCSSTFEAERVESTDDEMIDDSWNDSDARMVAETMVNEMLRQPWLNEFRAKSSTKRPVVIVSQVDNRTDEPYLDVKSLTDEIRTALINSRQISFVNKLRRSNINEEMEYQHGGNVDPAKARQLGKQTGAHYLLSGDIAVSIQTSQRRKIKAYKVTLNLTNLETSEIEWAQDKKVKKKFRY